MFEIAGFAPQTMTSRLCTTSSGSADSIDPNVDCHAAPAVAAQIVCSDSGRAELVEQPPGETLGGEQSRRTSCRGRGRPTTGPSSAIAAEIRDATRSSASSHDADRKSPAPFGADAHQRREHALGRVHPPRRGA